MIKDKKVLGEWGGKIEKKEGKEKKEEELEKEWELSKIR